MSTYRLSTAALAALVAAAGLSACGYPGGPLAAHDTLEETRALEPDGRFELENVSGRITLTTWSRSQVRIVAERAAISEEALGRIEVAIDGEGDEVRVRTRYSKRKTGFFRGSPGKVDYTITLPAGARARLQTVNGPVNVEGLTGDLRVESVNGGLELSGLGGEVRAKTVNGGIHARFEEIAIDAHHTFKTINGGIEITLPEGTGGRLEATTISGSIDCDLPLDVKTRKKRKLEGRLGPGGGSFDLSTVNGGIDVVRGPGSLPAEAEG